MDRYYTKRLLRWGTRVLCAFGDVNIGLIPGCYGLGIGGTITHGDMIHVHIRILNFYASFSVTFFLDHEDNRS